MKKTGVLMVAAVLINLFSSSLLQAAPLTDLTYKAQVFAGEPFNITVEVRQVSEVLAFGFNTSYDQSWTLQSAEVGLAFSDDSALFVDTDVAGSAFPAINGDPITLARLIFTPSVAGLFDFSIASDLANLHQGLFTLLDVFDITTSITVIVQERSETTIPEPSSIFLFGLGMFMLIAGRRWLLFPMKYFTSRGREQM